MIKLGNCPDSWGVWFAQNDKQPDWHLYLDELVQAGYQYTEIGPYGYMSTDPEELKEELGKRSLVPVAGTISFNVERDEEMLEKIEEAKKSCALLKAIGAEYYILYDGMYTDLITDEQVWPKELSTEEFKNFCKNYVELEKVVSSMGIKLLFHPHGGTHVETEAQIDAMIELVPDVRICFDTGHHIYVEGNDVYSYTEKIADRIDYFHFKDLNESIKEECWRDGIPYAAATKRNIFAEIGKGQIDWKRYGELLKKIGYNGYAVIEHDCYPPTPGESLAIQSRTGKYLESVGCGQLR